MTGTSQRNGIWSQENIDKLIKLWEAGLPASEISKQIPGTTKNAIIGKKSRLGLAARSSPILPKQEAAVVKKAAKPKVPRIRTKTPPKRPKLVRKGVPFMEADIHTCRSVIGRGYDRYGHNLVLFCPNPKSVEVSFCPHHQDFYYVKGRR